MTVIFQTVKSIYSRTKPTSDEAHYLQVHMGWYFVLDALEELAKSGELQVGTKSDLCYWYYSRVNWDRCLNP